MPHCTSCGNAFETPIINPHNQSPLCPLCRAQRKREKSRIRMRFLRQRGSPLIKKGVCSTCRSFKIIPYTKDQRCGACYNRLRRSNDQPNQVPCPICTLTLTQLTDSHLKTHNTSVAEQRRKNPKLQLVPTRTYPPCQGCGDNVPKKGNGLCQRCYARARHKKKSTTPQNN